MRYVLLLTALFVSMPGAVQAQETDWQRYYPLQVGDTWDYSHVERTCYDDMTCDTETDVFVRRTVVGEVTLNGLAYAEMEVAILDPVTAEATCTATYAVRINEEAERVEVEAIADLCADAFLGLYKSSEYIEEAFALTLGTPGMDEVTIGDVDYDLMVRRENVGLGLDEAYITLAQDVGLVDIWNTLDIGPSGSTDYDYFRLQYANVGGVIYGMAPVANESVTSEQTLRLENLYPNPARDHLTLEVQGDGTGSLSFDVFDVLGRQVLSRDLEVSPVGVSRHGLALWPLPAGLYFVRLSAASGEVATRRFVKVD